LPLSQAGASDGARTRNRPTKNVRERSGSGGENGSRIQSGHEK
jgi:hypothetical protein